MLTHTPIAMSFWQSFGLHSESEIDKLLAADDPPTLQQILEEEDIVQEAKSQNKKLISFLCEGDHLQQLIRYITVPQTNEQLAMESDAVEEENTQAAIAKKRKIEQRQYRYPYVCCQVLISDVAALTDAFFENDSALLRELLAVLDREESLPPLVASYVSRLLMYLLNARGVGTFEVFRSTPGLVERLVHHFDSSPVMELVIRLARVEENGIGDDAATWLLENRLVDLLLKGFSKGRELADDCIATVLKDIIYTAMQSSGDDDHIYNALRSDECVAALYDIAFSTTSTISARNHCLSVIEQLVVAAVPGVQRSTAIADMDAAIRLFFENADSIKRVLTVTDDSSESALETTFGTLSPPLGSHRLQVVELMKVVVELKNEEVAARAFSDGLMAIALDLFFRFVWNNVLQQNVVAMVLALIELGGDAKLRLFTECRLHERLAAEALLEENAGPKRRGIMGHVTRLAIAVEHDGASSSEVQKELGACDQWGLYTTTVLEETKRLDAGPDIAPSTGDDLSSDDDVDDDDDDGCPVVVQNFHLDFPENFGLVDFDDHETDDIFDASMYLTAGFNTDAPEFGKEFESESDEEEEEEYDEEYDDDDDDDDDDDE